MNSPARKPESHPTITGVKIGAEKVTVALSDGRDISIPVTWFPRLASASRRQLRNFEISPGGYGIHWPEIDEDISVKAFLG